VFTPSDRRVLSPPAISRRPYQSIGFHAVNSRVTPA
jgi:hypothetical protein